MKHRARPRLRANGNTSGASFARSSSDALPCPERRSYKATDMSASSKRGGGGFVCARNRCQASLASPGWFVGFNPPSAARALRARLCAYCCDFGVAFIVPRRPNSTMNVAPDDSACQNFALLPSTNSNRRTRHPLRATVLDAPEVLLRMLMMCAGLMCVSSSR